MVSGDPEENSLECSQEELDGRFMDGWMDEWTDEWIDRWMDGWQFYYSEMSLAELVKVKIDYSCEVASWLRMQGCAWLWK